MSERIEGTQFYRRSAIREALRIVVVTVAVFSVLLVLSFWAAIDIGARQAYKEARDIRTALRVVGTEYYGGLSSIYDPESPTGLTDGAARKIADISQRNGDVFLYEWDEYNNAPVRFEYHKGLYRVVYSDYGSSEGSSAGTSGDFNVYYSFEILKYEAE